MVNSNSLLTNNKDDFEWIIVDDGSDDDTELIVREWLKEEKINLRYFKKENGGKTRAVKKGFDSGVKGKYTLVLDSDDYLVNGIISELKENLINSKPKCIGLAGLKGNKQHGLIGMEF